MPHDYIPVDHSGVRVFCGELLSRIFKEFLIPSTSSAPVPSPVHPPSHYAGPKLVNTFKIYLKFSKIKQEINKRYVCGSIDYSAKQNDQANIIYKI